jgi:hypothetical protein
MHGPTQHGWISHQCHPTEHGPAENGPNYSGDGTASQRGKECGGIVVLAPDIDALTTPHVNQPTTAEV